MAKPTRRQSRETAFALLFEWSFKEDSLENIIELADEAGNIQVDEFARELAEKAVAGREEIDALIEQYSQGRKLSRISKTALAVLRMCFCELTQFENIPVGASINEGVELLKKYGTDEEAAYLNGILGSFERVRKGLMPAPSIPEKETTIQYNDDNTHTQQNTQDTNNSNNTSDDGVELLDDIIIEVE